MSAKKERRKKSVTVLLNSDIVAGAVEKSLKKMGYEIRRDIESCVQADFAVIGAYFLVLGVVNQMHSANPSLPLVLIAGNEDRVNGNGSLFYDVIKLDGFSQMEAAEKISKWFTEGSGQFLIKKNGDAQAKSDYPRGEKIR